MRLAGQANVYDTSARPSAFIEEMQSLYRYRELIVQLISRSVKTRYKRSFLGVAWTMINPLLTMSVLTLVFSGLFGFPARSYALYVLSGLLLWNFFAQTTTAAMGDLIWSGGLIGRVYLPKSIFAVSRHRPDAFVPCRSICGCNAHVRDPADSLDVPNAGDLSDGPPA